MQSQSNMSSHSEIDEQLSAYFDDELEASVRASIEAELERDPELAAKLADLSFMRTIVAGDLEAQAERVPEARFEQLWDSFEITLERESRLQEAAEAPPKWWQRLREWARPIRVPLAAVATIGVLAFVIARSVGAPGEEELAANTQEKQASEGQPVADGEAAPTVRTNDQIAAAEIREPIPDAEVFPQPEPGEAEIRRIEFGGNAGTISQVEGRRGTTTVIWVTEDEDPVDSERSL
jgi:anti-sigma factor RsiW